MEFAVEIAAALIATSVIAPIISGVYSWKINGIMSSVVLSSGILGINVFALSPKNMSGTQIINNVTMVQIICKIATLIFCGANCLATQCGEAGVPIELEMNIDIKRPSPNVPVGVKSTPFSRGGPPSIVGAVVVARVSIMF